MYKRDIGEEWLTATESMSRKGIDCEDFHTLVYTLARLCGISQFQLMASIGWVYHRGYPNNREGHFWLLYFSTTYNKWFSIDATYYPDLTLIKYRTPFSISSKRYQSIWYMFNEEISFKGDNP